MINRGVKFCLCFLLCCATLVLAGEVSSDLRKTVEADWKRQEQVTHNLKCDSPQALTGAIARGRLMITDMRMIAADDAADSAEMAILEVEALRDAMPGNGSTYEELYYKVRWAIRELALHNPAINFDELLFVKRQWPRWNHQCSHRVGEAQTAGANLCVLKGLSGDGKVREILSGSFADGGIGRPDLSYDAKRIVFPFAAKRKNSTAYGSGMPGHRGGQCYAYDIYEVGIDGSGLKRLTNGSETEDTEPIYLPDGRIAFMTSRDDRYVQCGDWALACGMYTMNTDGGDLRQVTEPKEGEFYPNMLEDGRIMYTRWDYVMKGYNVIQQLWAVNPDGRKAGLLFGDHYSFSVGPIAFQEARQIPNTSKVICVGAAHHNTGVGPIMIVDMRQNRGGRDSMVNVTPEIGYPEINGSVLREVSQDELAGRGISTTHNKTGWYGSPYPLTNNHYLASYSYDVDNTSATGYGIYLMDVHGNKELIYRAKDHSCYSPIPLRSRSKPRIIPDKVKDVDPSEPGTVIITDIYQGLDGISRGEVKYLRILETHSKTVRTTPQRCDVGVNSGWDVRGVLGTVPVEEDGSVHFYLPPRKQIFFEAIDENYLEIRRMRNFMNVMPGESVSCTGCHEPYGATATNNTFPQALQRKPSQITPPPWGTEGFSFAKFVQPVLDSKCVNCHDGSEGKDKSFDLRGIDMLTAPVIYDADQGPQHMVSDSFLNLVEYVDYIQVGGYQGEKMPLASNATGSRRSELMKLLADGHYDISLDISQWRTLAAWIDCNAPYYGDWENIIITPSRPSMNVTSGGGVTLLRSITAKDRQRIDHRMRELDDESTAIKAYIDCGVQSKSTGTGRETITQLNGKGWSFCDASTIDGVSTHGAEVTFANNAIMFDLANLQQGVKYKLGLTWWDHNGVARKQSIWASHPDGSKIQKIYDATVLPEYNGKGQMPEQIVIDLPGDLIENGVSRVCIWKEGGYNAVISEVWLGVAK